MGNDEAVVWDFKNLTNVKAKNPSLNLELFQIRHIQSNFKANEA